MYALDVCIIYKTTNNSFARFKIKTDASNNITVWHYKLVWHVLEEDLCAAHPVKTNRT